MGLSFLAFESSEAPFPGVKTMRRVGLGYAHVRQERVTASPGTSGKGMNLVTARIPAPSFNCLSFSIVVAIPASAGSRDRPLEGVADDPGDVVSHAVADKAPGRAGKPPVPPVIAAVITSEKTPGTSV